MSCAPHTSLGEINDSVVKSERGELVGGSDPPLVYRRHYCVIINCVFNCQRSASRNAR